MILTKTEVIKQNYHIYTTKNKNIVKRLFTSTKYKLKFKKQKNNTIKQLVLTYENKKSPYIAVKA